MSQIECIVFQADSPESVKHVTQKQHIGFEMIMIVSQILHPKCGPNSLSMVINGLTNSEQVGFAVEHFSWGGGDGSL